VVSGTSRTLATASGKGVAGVAPYGEAASSTTMTERSKPLTRSETEIRDRARENPKNSEVDDMGEEEQKCGCGDNCGCGSSACGCGEADCSCGSGCGGDSCCPEDSMPKMMLGLANQAWAELMKEKMRKHYEAARGKRMDAMAKVSVDACLAYWDGKLQQKGQFEEFAKKLQDAMGS